MPKENLILSIVDRITASTIFRWASFVAVVLTFVGFVLSIPPVQNSLFGKRLSVTLELVSEISVFDVHRSIDELKVEFNGQDLISSNRDLVATRIRLHNTGEVSITPVQVVPEDPLGFSISGGDIIRINGVQASSEHIRKFSQPRISGNSVLISPSIIIDPDDYIDFDVLIIKGTGSNLSYSPTGKIENLKDIYFVRFPNQEENRGFFSRTFSGGLLVQFVRLPAYFFLMVIILVLFIWSIVSASGVPARRRFRRRQALARRLESESPNSDPMIRKFASSLYASVGYKRLKSFQKKLVDNQNTFSESDASNDLRDDVHIQIDELQRQAVEGSYNEIIMDKLDLSDRIDIELGAERNIKMSSLYRILRRFNYVDSERVIKPELFSEISRVLDKLEEERLERDLLKSEPPFGDGLSS